MDSVIPSFSGTAPVLRILKIFVPVYRKTQFGTPAVNQYASVIISHKLGN